MPWQLRPSNCILVLTLLEVLGGWILSQSISEGLRLPCPPDLFPTSIKVAIGPGPRPFGHLVRILISCGNWPVNVKDINSFGQRCGDPWSSAPMYGVMIGVVNYFLVMCYGFLVNSGRRFRVRSGITSKCHKTICHWVKYAHSQLWTALPHDVWTIIWLPHKSAIVSRSLHLLIDLSSHNQL